MNSEERNPLNFTQAEWQQSKRVKQDPRAIKETFQDCWAISDSMTAFASALEERGYYLAKGDRRGFVALDWRGEVYAISRWVGIKAKEVKAKLGDPEKLLSVDDTKLRLSEKFTDKLQHFIDVSIAEHKKAAAALNNKRKALTNHHRGERSQLKQLQFKQRVIEVKARSARLPTGLKALWFRVTGKYSQIKKRNESETMQCKLRDQSEMQKLIDRQLGERQHIQREVRQIHHQHTNETKRLNSEINEYFHLSPAQQAVCMKAASAAGLPTAKVEFRQVEGIDYLLVERYDRQKRIVPGAPIFYERLHQEDFCQALGIPAEIKYQSEGGPSLKQCFTLLRDVSRVPIIDLQHLLDAVIFNILIGNHDAHGKNFSFTCGEGTLLTGKDIRLAPLYDLVSTVYYPELTPKMAMKVGGESRSEKLRPRHLEKLAVEANLAKPMVIQRVPELARTILETIDEIDIVHPVGRDVIDLIKKRCERFIHLFKTT